jgi:uncharacterized glyoxalase superfamily protein PhnB
MSTPRFDQINVVVADPGAAMSFLAALGAEADAVTPGWEEWAAHHRKLPVAGEFEVEVDSARFARHWGGLPDGFSGVVVNLRVDERDEVDALYTRALEAGGTGLREPYDAFWGSRFATLMGPGPLAVGLISPRDPSRMSKPPEVGDFA